jgi:subtilisin family serine protease
LTFLESHLKYLNDVVCDAVRILEFACNCSSGPGGRSAVSLVMSVLAVRCVCRSNTDDAVKAAVASGQSARVIMQFATTAERDAAFRRPARSRRRGSRRRYGSGFVAGRLRQRGVVRRRDSHATQVSLDAGVRVLGQPARDTSAPMPIGIGSAPSTISGSGNGISVAIVDSGLAPHADLPLSRIRAYKDFVSGGRTPVDNCGHGTHVAGIVAGSGAHSNGLYAGIAPDVDIVALRVLGDDCSGNTSDVIDALEWIRAPSPDLPDQGRQHLARARRARIDLQRPAGAGGGAAVAQGHRGGDRGRQQGLQRRESEPGLRRRRRAVQCAVGDLRRLARHAGHA